MNKKIDLKQYGNLYYKYNGYYGYEHANNYKQ